jgi:ubiquinol-cytochrome c reductase cytochrome c1 subunit
MNVVRAMISKLMLQSRALVVALSAIACLAAVLPAHAAGGGGVKLDKFPVAKMNDLPSLQNGAKVFVNYCMGCHSAKSMRFNRMRDLGLDEKQIKEHLVFGDAKVGDLMRIPMRAGDAKTWLGAAPPDLSVTARSRSSGDGSGSDWMYTFLRSYYRDANRPTGWNNSVFKDTGMPHVLWQLQGQRGATITEVHAHGADGHGGGTFVEKKISIDTLGLASVTEGDSTNAFPKEGVKIAFSEPTGGKLGRLAYDDTVGDLVAFLTYVSDPSAKDRARLGIWVLMFLAFFFFAAWMLNKAFWKDIK